MLIKFIRVSRVVFDDFHICVSIDRYYLCFNFNWLIGGEIYVSLLHSIAEIMWLKGSLIA